MGCFPNKFKPEEQKIWLKNAWWQTRNTFVRSCDLLLWLLGSHFYVIGIHCNRLFIFLFYLINGKRRQARAWSAICRDQLRHHDSKKVTHRGEKRYINKTVTNKDAKKGKNDITALTKNVEPPAQETRVVTNTSKLLKENYKLRHIIARWKGDLVQRGQIRLYASIRLD